MATAVLESVAVPRPSSALPRTAPQPRMAVRASGRTTASLPVCRGLRVVRRASRVSSSSPAVVRRAVRRPVVCEVQDTALDVLDVTTDTWKSLVLDSDVPVLVEFWAPWCGPCRIILPVIGELSRQYAGKLRCYKINTDECPELATQFGIRSIPTIMVFKNGDKKDTVIGAVPKSALVSCIEKFL